MKKIEQNEIRIFYDNTCGFCDKFIRFIIPRIKKGASITFNSQKGKRYNHLKNQFSNMFFPDSIVVYIEKENKMVFKIEAVISIFRLLVWPWKIINSLLKIIPIKIMNFFYDYTAKVRYKIFKRSNKICAVIPKEWKKLFEDENSLI